VCVDAMGKLMMTNHWPLEASIIIGEQKANVKDKVRAWWASCRRADLSRLGNLDHGDGGVGQRKSVENE
jgi:hypothetical protein